MSAAAAGRPLHAVPDLAPEPNRLAFLADFLRSYGLGPDSLAAWLPPSAAADLRAAMPEYMSGRAFRPSLHAVPDPRPLPAEAIHEASRQTGPEPGAEAEI